ATRFSRKGSPGTTLLGQPEQIAMTTPSMPDRLVLPPAGSARGSVTLPGSKSISNRVLLLSALAQGQTELRGLLDSDDTRVMLDSLQRLGVPIEHDAGGVLRVSRSEERRV